MTDSLSDAETPLPPRRGLWAVMGQTAAPTVAARIEVPEELPVAPIDVSSSDDSQIASTSVNAATREDVAYDEPTLAEAAPKVATSGRRGLWSLMGQATTEPSAGEIVAEVSVAAASTAANSSAVNSARTHRDVRVADDAPQPAATSRGLFSLMQRVASDAARVDESQASSGTPRVFNEHRDDREKEPQATPFAEPQSVPLSPASIASVPHSALRAPHSPESPPTLTIIPSPEDRREGTRAVDDVLEETLNEADLTRPLSMTLIDPEDLEPPRYLKDAALAMRRSWIGLACGVTALLMSALTILPQVWIGVPATAFGFAAIIVGYLTLTGAAARELPISWRMASIGGMALGAFGVFLGPLFFSGLGRSLREATGLQATGKHLLEIGVALNRHHDQHSAFPVGGVFSHDAAGLVKGQHGWMTFLLPFLGEHDLYLLIDQDQSYDDPANRAAMSRDVEAYFAAGGDRAKIVQGYAVSHFAGVGGEIDDKAGLSHVGIFQRDEAVKRDEVTDGLSNTLIVGELPGSFPPWGDPENWRTTGRGINKDANGFGNATRTGATFLLGDGSVKFLSNKTDPKLLRKLSTRDGGE